MCGYPPRDLVERRSFVAAAEKATARVARASGETVWLFGTLLGNRARSGRPVFNAAVAARNGKTLGVYRKRLLPTYDVFDEGRYFEPGTRPLALRVAGRRVGVTICEDIWNDKTFWKRPLYPTDPVAELQRGSLDLHVNISASPYTLGKNRLRRRMMCRIAQAYGRAAGPLQSGRRQRRPGLRRRLHGVRRAGPSGRRGKALRGGLLDHRPAGGRRPAGGHPLLAGGPAARAGPGAFGLRRQVRVRERRAGALRRNRLGRHGRPGLRGAGPRARARRRDAGALLLRRQPSRRRRAGSPAGHRS